MNIVTQIMFYNQLTTKADLMKTNMRPFKEICDFREVLNQSPKNTHILYMYLIDYILTYIIHITIFNVYLRNVNQCNC